MFVEGEFFEVETYWHIPVPCKLDLHAQRFEASVRLLMGARFRFFFWQQDGTKVYVVSECFEVDSDFDGNILNVYRYSSDSQTLKMISSEAPSS